MRRFVLNRLEDATGISGTGLIAEGVVFSRGNVGLVWLPPWDTISIYPSIGAVEAIHGHGGLTRVEWID